jgi:hypothetical protein
MRARPPNWTVCIRAHAVRPVIRGNPPSNRPRLCSRFDAAVGRDRVEVFSGLDHS